MCNFSISTGADVGLYKSRDVAEKPHDAVVKFERPIEIYSGIAQFCLL